MRRYEFDDAHEEPIREFSTGNRRPGHLWRGHRQVLNGIFRMLQVKADERGLLVRLEL